VRESAAKTQWRHGLYWEVPRSSSSYSLSQIAKATGLSLAACSRIRAEASVPHPRHWGSFAALVKAERSRLCHGLILPGAFNAEGCLQG
jgi:hypothetical protein